MITPLDILSDELAMTENLHDVQDRANTKSLDVDTTRFRWTDWTVLVEIQT